MLPPPLSSVANGKGSLVGQPLATVCRASGLVDTPGHQEILEENGAELAEQRREPLGFPGMFRTGRGKESQKCCGPACGDTEGRCWWGSEGCAFCLT